MNRLKKILTSIFLVFAISSSAFAQNQPPADDNTNTTKKAGASSAGPRKQLAVIIFAGLGGSILGLSTLSFYGRPQEKLNNIAIGFAFGIIAGTGFVTYKAMSNPAEFYSSKYWSEPQQLGDTVQVAAHERPLSLQYNLEF